MATKTVQIDLTKLAHVENPKVSDGLGGEHSHGAVIALPSDTADQLIAAGFARPVDAKIAANAVAAAKERAEELKTAAQHARAKSAMDVWDSLPPEVRAEAQEHGQEVVERYLAGLPSMSLDDYEAASGEPFAEAADKKALKEFGDALSDPMPKRRGRPPKIRPALEGEDAQ